MFLVDVLVDILVDVFSMPLLLLTDHTSRNLLLNCKITALIFDWLDKPQQHKIKSGHLSSMHIASGQVSFFGGDVGIRTLATLSGPIAFRVRPLRPA